MRLFLIFLRGWARIDLRIARNAPVLNIKHLEQLRRDEDKWDREIVRWEMNHGA